MLPDFSTGLPEPYTLNLLPQTLDGLGFRVNGEALEKIGGPKYLDVRMI